MSLEAKVSALSEIEKKTLTALDADYKTIAEIEKKTGIGLDSVRRAVGWLSDKKLASISEEKGTATTLSEKGKKALEEGLPEKKILEIIKDTEKTSLNKIRQDSKLSPQEFNIGLGINRRKAFIFIVNENEPMVQITEVGKEFAGTGIPEEKALKEIFEKGESKDSESVKSLISRGLCEAKQVTERKVKITEDGEKAKGMKEFSGKRKYSISEPAPTIYPGKKQPYIQFLNKIRRKLTELGFKEMEAPLIVHEFYNFDVLFQPQNHPARTWTDTYQLKSPSQGKLSDRKSVKAIKEAHETGGRSVSSGWGYQWIEEIAERMMPTAHGTAHSARQLTKGVEMPGKYFAIARCFRPDVLDATHLIEFNQTEGFIVGEELNFKHLLGILEQFAKEIAGAEEVRFYPDYYPFTEPSVQLSAKHPKLGWVELGGAGMFRPEILENLGIKGQAIAWGIGIDRLAMFRLGIKDIRYLFSDDLEWLRKTPMVRD